MLTSLFNTFNGLLVYVPLSIIGLWRWSYWIVRRVLARAYRIEYTSWPKGYPVPTVTVVTPVYNENPKLFENAMNSWIANGVNEIIVVIDKTDRYNIVNFLKKYSPNKKVACRMVVTPKPGKRAALCDGIELAKGEIIALVDSDTVWSSDVLEKSLPHFANPSIGGTTVAQRIYKPKHYSDVMFDILLWTRYKEEVPFLLGAGRVFNTLSGRTAFYRREALLNDNYDNLHHLRHEKFLGTRGISGDDKRLSHLLLEQGWHVQSALNTTVYTLGLGSARRFLKQRLRWTRNSWRADLRAFRRRWVLKHPALAFFMLDRFVQPFFMLLGPITLVLAILAEDWITASILLAWWLVSRFVKLFGYFRESPGRLVYLPVYIIYSYINAIMKIYALATLLEHSWATRWHKNRLSKARIKKALPLLSGTAAVILLIVGLYNFGTATREASGVNISLLSQHNSQLVMQEADFASNAPVEPVLPKNALPPGSVQTYTVLPNDTLSSISEKLGMSISDLKKLNGVADPDEINVGRKIMYYKAGE